MQDFYSFFFLETGFLKTIIALVYSFFAIFFAVKFFYKVGFVDNPNNRSCHSSPIALGGGVIVVPLILITSIQLGFKWNYFVLFSLIILFAISFLDDLKNISPINRLIFHIISIGFFVLFFLLPYIKELFNINYYLMMMILLVIILSITWFVNAFNFMDGINGITSVEVIYICSSLIFFYYFLDKKINILAFSIILSIVSFSYYNWTPAKIFLGDTGSISLGFLIIYLLIVLGVRGYWVTALLLPLYYLMDTSITLLIRIINKKKFWIAHNEHFYQKAIRKGFSHEKVNFYIILVNLGLFILSFFSLIYKNDIKVLLIGMVWCAFFLVLFSKKKSY